MFSMCGIFQIIIVKAGDVLSIPVWQLLGKEQHRERLAAIKTVSQVDVTYESSESMPLHDARESVRLAALSHQDDGKNGNSFDSDNNRYRPAREM